MSNFFTHDGDQDITKPFFHFSIVNGLIFDLTKDIMDIFRTSDFFEQRNLAKKLFQR